MGFVPTESWRRRFLLAGGFSLILGSLALGQGTPGTSSGEPATADGLKIHGASLDDLGGLLSSRNRETLHPGAPLDLVGNEEGDNGFRHRVPLLEGASDPGNLVNVEALRARRLAMYDTASVFHTPLPAISPTPGSRGASARRPEPGRADSLPDQYEPGADGTVNRILFGVLVGLLAFIWRGRLGPV